MTIDVNYNNVGMICYLGSGGTVKNLALNNANVKGNDNVGGIAGNNYGTITACSSAGGNVSSTYMYAVVGGIAGNNHGTITACSSAGSKVSGNYDAGGIAGLNNGTVTACWSTASVSGTTYVGGIAGWNNSYPVTACYTTQDIGSGGGTQVADIPALNGTAVLTVMNNALAALNAGAGIGYEWAASTNTATDGPVLKKTLTYNATTNTYTAYTATGLMAINTVTTSGETAPADADGNKWTSDKGNYFAVNITLGADITLPTVADGKSNWTPIGDKSNPYTGTFDGGGHTLTGLTISVYFYYTGLISYLGSGGTVKNLALKDANVNGTYDAGGIVCYNAGGTITACSSTGGNVKAGKSSNYAGGIVGDNEGGTITACWSTATVSSDFHVGGIAGYNHDGTINTCYTTNGNITSSSNTPINTGGFNCTTINSATTITDMNAALTGNSYKWAAGTELPYLVPN